jgi:hypothetical protein
MADHLKQIDTPLGLVDSACSFRVETMISGVLAGRGRTSRAIYATMQRYLGPISAASNMEWRPFATFR